MSHLTLKHSYQELAERLNRFPQGAPPSDTLFQILSILFSEKEASLVAQLPIRPFTAKKAASIWGIPQAEAAKVLMGLADRCILLDMEVNGEVRYLLPPPMAGFLEFSMMRTRSDIDQKLLGELFYQYMNVEEDFIKALFFSSETRLGRVFINEKSLERRNITKVPSELAGQPGFAAEQPGHAVEILDFQRASHVIDTASHIGIGLCYCRHKMEHAGRECEIGAPVEDICMTFGNVADSLIRHGYARRVDASECRELLHKAYESNLVQCGENVRQEVSFICNCCGCCCEALVAARKFGNLHPVVTTGFLPEIDSSTCTGCGRCQRVCQVDVIRMVDQDGKKIPLVEEELCLGCGLCIRACRNGSVWLKSTGKKTITPATSVHRVVLMAIEKGMLQELIFDQRALYSHRAMAAILSSILKLSPVKKAMASQQLKSVYLDRLLSKG